MNPRGRFRPKSHEDQKDTMIAAHALACNQILVTNNTREFARVPQLRLQNWAEE